jgi:hypothetical protein
MNGERLPVTNEIVSSTGSAAAIVSLPACVARTTTFPPEPVRMFPLNEAAPDTNVRVTGRADVDVAVRTTPDPAIALGEGEVSVIVCGRFVT